MAKCIAEATGYDSSRSKYVHRLGSVSAATTCATWHTFIESSINADGSGKVYVRQNGAIILSFPIPPE